MKSIDLFAGAGGLSCGLKMAGFHTVLANELVPVYASSFQENNPNTITVVGDVRLVSDADIKKQLGVRAGQIDLVAGGPPCQGFSINAPIRSLNDERNHLFRDFLRVVASVLPRAVLIENVPGMVSLGRGTVISKIYQELEAIGYKVAHKILFAGHYGVPQMRFRTIIIGVRGYDGEIVFPDPEYNAKANANFSGSKTLCLKVEGGEELKHPVVVGDALGDLPVISNGQKISPKEYCSEPQNDYQRYLRRGAKDLSLHHCARVGAVNLERLKYIPQGGSWRDIPFELLPKGLQRARRSDHTKRYGRIAPDALCSTILTKCDPHWGSFYHPTQDRVISVREAARIQSFPDDYIFGGNVTQQYEQVGNAVPPRMAMAIGTSLRSMLE